MTYTNRHICHCCGQDIIIPNELTSINLRGSHRLILFKLFRYKGSIVPYETFGYTTKSIQVFICAIREALADLNLPYVIRNIPEEGYVLEDRA